MLTRLRARSTSPGKNAQSGVMLRGQSQSLEFDKTGTIAYARGLHPGAKGTIEAVGN